MYAELSVLQSDLCLHLKFILNLERSLAMLVQCSFTFFCKQKPIQRLSRLIFCNGEDHGNSYLVPHLSVSLKTVALLQARQ